MIPSVYRYMESTRHLMLYRVESAYPVPAGMCMRNVETVCLLHCAPAAVERFLRPSLFPALRRIHYLSAPPEEVTLHRRFGIHTQWVFPAFQRALAAYPFYDRMIEGGWGKQEPGLVDQYVVQAKQRGKETWFDFYLPMRGIVEGDWYYAQQMAYLYKKHCDAFQVICPTQAERPGDRSYLPPPMSTYALTDSRWVHGAYGACDVSQGEDMELMFQRVILGA